MIGTRIPPRCRLGALWSVLAGVLAVVVASGCGPSSKEIIAAKTSGYDADFAIVFSEARAAVAQEYPHLVDSPRRGVIETAWHYVNVDDRHGATSAGPTMAAMAGGNTLPARQSPLGRVGEPRTFYFVKFRVSVVGGSPWRIRIKGEAQKYEEGSTPVPLRGADTPSWLPARVDGLRLAIHRRLARHAVRLQTTEVGEEPAEEPVDDSVFPELAQLPPAAGRVVSAVRRAAEGHRYTALRGLVADDVVWSPGAPGDATQAMALWQADPSLLDRLARDIAKGCARSGASIVCPPEGEGQASFEKVGSVWRLRRFAPE